MGKFQRKYYIQNTQDSKCELAGVGSHFAHGLEVEN